MKPSLSPFVSLLLVTLMLPGLSRAGNVNHQGTEGLRGPRQSREESSAQGKNGSPLLHHQEKRYVLPRTPPYPEPEPDFKVVDCKKSEGYCQEYCNYMETQVGYCFKKKYVCCLHQN
ncbi:sperm-associated antigen 11B-like [Phoca vitulina]|uniref:sperm-associated antigen 11B-like n=1 Tax=Phoca vitulina TaxID=9720 RepID=UPI001396461F|nr:sperm-associated antigen 11B-like [Phoca vitulina]